MSVNDNILVFSLTNLNQFEDIRLTNSNKKFIADFRDVDLEILKAISEKLCNFGDQVYANAGSFIVVSEYSFSAELNIVPTLQEAYDFIEMEDIERQLDIDN